MVHRTGTVVVLEQPAEPSLTPNVIDGNRWRCVFIRAAANQSVSDALVWSALVIVGDVLADDVIEVSESEDDKVIQGLVFHALDPSLDEGVQVGCSGPDPFDLDSAFTEDGRELFGILAIPITHKGLAGDLPLGRMFQEGTRLLFHPVTARRKGPWRDEHAS